MGQGVESEAVVDLNGLMGMLNVGDGKARSNGFEEGGANSTSRQRKGSSARSEEYREKGNSLFKLGAYEGAVDYYTRAINADPQNEKALGNRCAAYTMMGSYREALNDAAYGIQLKPGWAKLQSRKAVAHFYLKEYDESVAAYKAALSLDPGNQEYQSGLEQAKKLGGSAENLRKREREARERQRREEAAARLGERLAPKSSKARTIEDQLRLRAEKDKARMERYERDLVSYKQTRRECAERWRESTGKTGNEMPEEDRGRSVRVDIFGYLRGKCAESDCTGWHRDVDAIHNAWGNMDAIKCSVCGRSNADHENCGQYPLNEPIKPNGGPGELKIPGIHKAR